MIAGTHAIGDFTLYEYKGLLIGTQIITDEFEESVFFFVVEEGCL